MTVADLSGDDLTIPELLRRDICSKCGVGGELFGYKVEGVMTWYCAEHRLAKHYADARLPVGKLSTPPPAPRNDLLAEHANAIRILGKRVVADVIEIGRHLVEAQKLAGHGNWLSWLEREFAWTDRHARNFMRVYEMAGKSENISDLDLPVTSLYLLAAPTTPESARQEVFDRVERGERIMPLYISWGDNRWFPPPQRQLQDALYLAHRQARRVFIRAALTGSSEPTPYDRDLESDRRDDSAEAE